MRWLAFAISVLLCARAYAEPQQLETTPNTRRVAGKWAVAVGTGLVVSGVALGFYANYKYEQAFEDPDGGGPKDAPCGDEFEGRPQCTRSGYSQTQSARTLGSVGTVTAIIGLVAVGTGAVLWATAPPDETRVVPTASSNAGGVAIVGTF